MCDELNGTNGGVRSVPIFSDKELKGPSVFGALKVALAGSVVCSGTVLGLPVEQLWTDRVVLVLNLFRETFAFVEGDKKDFNLAFFQRQTTAVRERAHAGI